MSEKELYTKLQAEYTRCVEMLGDYHPCSDHYRDLLTHISSLRWLREEPDAGCETDFTSPAPAKGAVSEAWVAETDPAEEETAHVDEGIDYKEYRLALRADLVEARRKGVNTSELMQVFGVSKYGDVPDQKLPELRAEMEKALAEKESA